MFGNLKKKVGDVTDLKKLSSPQSLSGVSVASSRQRSNQQTPGTQTPGSRHSRQASTASLQGLGLPISPPHSITHSPQDQNGSLNQDRSAEVAELEREVSKLRAALESQQDAGLTRLNAKDHEWRGKIMEEQDKMSEILNKYEESLKREEELKKKLDGAESSKSELTEQLTQAGGLETRVIETQDNYDQLEGLNSQEVAKIKHLLLNTNSELEEVKSKLTQKSESLVFAESRLATLSALPERLSQLNEEKTELESQVVGLNHKLSSANTRNTSVEEERSEEAAHLQQRISTLEQRHTQTNMQETDKIQALIKERETMEHKLEEARQQLNNIKSSWSDKITSLENQIQNLTAKITEDQGDLNKSEESCSQLSGMVSSLKSELTSQKNNAAATEEEQLKELSQLKEDVESLKWQLNTTSTDKDQEITSLNEQLITVTEKSELSSNEAAITLENYSKTQEECKDLESELLQVKDKLTSALADLLNSQKDKKAVEDTLQQERNARELVMKEREDLENKLHVVTGEKTRLSQNLDEYVEKEERLEESVKLLETRVNEEVQIKSNIESKLSEKEQDNEGLRTDLLEYENELVHKIENSDLVQDLREKIKGLEDELVEKKQALKVQGGRLADMKKTIQRELKLSPDSTDSITDLQKSGNDGNRSATAATGVATFTSVPVSHVLNHAGTGQPITNGALEEDPPNLQYLKHVIIKFLTSRESEAVSLTKAVATLLHMSPEEEKLLRETLEYKMSWFGNRPNLGRGQTAKAIPPST